MELFRTACSKLRDYLIVNKDSLFHPSASAILDDVIKYIFKSNECGKVRSIRDMNIIDKSRRPSGFTEDIGKVVLVLILGYQCEDEFVRQMLTLTTRKNSVNEQFLENYLGNEILIYGRVLESGTPHDCLAYFAVICELIRQFSSPRHNYLRRRILIDAKRCMSKHAAVFGDYRHLDSYAKECLEKWGIM